jgi:membrane-bound lytic murein transglycosylase B
VRIGGRRGARPVAAAAPKRTRRAKRTPAFGIAVITPLVFAGAVGGEPPPFPGKTPAMRAAVTPVAAVSPSVPGLSDLLGPAVVALQRQPTSFHVAAANISAPPPPMIVNVPGALGIPSVALAAYRNAELKMAAADPNCGVSWNLLAGIGRIESGHAGGGAVDARGTAIYPIYGPALDGTLPGNEVIIQSNVGNRPTYARAMGPMQFLPGTWARYASDGDGDGVADPQNLFDATLAAARYLCSGGLNLRDPGQVMAAILRYNNSMPYAQNVLGWAAAYATGVVPVDLPPITGPPPPLGDAHFENTEGLGPGLPMNVNGMPGLTGIDPLSQVPLIDLSPQTPASQAPMFPWMAPSSPPTVEKLPGCTLICIGPQSPAAPPPGLGPPPPDAVAPAGAPPVDPQAPPPTQAAPAAAGAGRAAPKASPSPKPGSPQATAPTQPPANAPAPNDGPPAPAG